MSIPCYSRLSSHPFIREVMSNLSPFIKDVGDRFLEKVKESGTIRSSKTSSPSWPTSYDLDVFWKASYLMDSFELMEEAQLYIDHFPQPRAYERKGITQDKWIEYHYQIHVVTLVGIEDRAFHLTNSVFRLGLDPQDCRAGAVMNNAWIRGTDVADSLKKIKKLINPERDTRHGIIHRGQRPNIAAVIGSEQYDFLELFASCRRLSPRIELGMPVGI